jgi:toxin CptA
LGGLLFATGAPWSYPALLKELGNLTFGQGATFAPAAIAGPFALFTGAIASGASNGRFVLQAFSGAQLARSFTGGATMGFATILIPGGNDSLLLSAMPSLAVHGAVAYLAMLGMQIGSVRRVLQNRLRRPWYAGDDRSHQPFGEGADHGQGSG